ncbi:MAG: hypothetical protein HUK00_07115 [Bacteroidaceae bacterium]|nr:hypothetical protein [Bacteroidaceae bacterium]
MRKTLILMLTLTMLTVGTTAQKKAKVPEPTIEENIAAYRFEAAEAQLKKEITALKRKRKPTDALEQRLRQVEHLSSLLDATQRVVFIDSLVVPKRDFFEHITLSDESGDITSYARTFRTTDSLSCTVFHPELGNSVFLACPKSDSTAHLCSATLYAGSYSEPMPLSGLTGDHTQNYPFMLADGLTLYFGAINDDEGLGGYDIYAAGWDIDDRSFRKPENLGFPFNSPFNDYLLAIDEVNNLGWFVSDRYQPADTVCIYTFIPPKMRRNWVDTGFGQNTSLAALARISRIADTQTSEEEVLAAQARLAKSREGVKSIAKKHRFTFVMADGDLRHDISDFRRPEAQKLAKEWYDAHITLQAYDQQLASLRRQYANANTSKRAQMRANILSIEREQEQLLAKQKVRENQIRKIEQP